MPLLMLFGQAQEGTSAAVPVKFDSRVRLEASGIPFRFRSYVRPDAPAPFTFASLVRLDAGTLSVALWSFVRLTDDQNAETGEADPAAPDEDGLSPTTGKPAPVRVMPGLRPQRWEMICPLGQAVQASYEHSGETETATLTLKTGQQLPDALPIYAKLGDAPAFAAHLTVDTRQYEVSRSRSDGVTTVVRLYNAAAQKAQSEPLPELVDWVYAPRFSFPEDYTQGGKRPPRPALRTIGVSDLVRRGFASIGVGFAVIGADPFEGETYQEKLREVSTRGRTAADLFGETYGALGYRLIVRGAALFGVPPGRGLTDDALTFSRCELDSLTERGEAANVPRMIRLSAADKTVYGPLPKIPTDSTPEDDAKASWLDITPTENGYTYSAGYVFEGLLRETQEGEIGRVEVGETVDGRTMSRVFEGVLISDTRTAFQYHADCPDAVIWQETTKRGFSYSLGTQTRMEAVTGYMYDAYLPAGDLIENTVERVTQEWYEAGDFAGYLKVRRAESSRLVSVAQENAEGSPEQRGAVKAREYVTEVNTDIYRRIGNNWTRSSSVTGGVSVPLYDAGTGEPVRMSLKTGAQRTSTQIMRNDPPRVEWPKKDAQDVPQRAELSVPQRVAYALQGGNVATLDQSFGMLKTGEKLAMFAELLARANGPRVSHEAALSVPRVLLPGTPLKAPVAGIVESLSINIDGLRASASVSIGQLETPALTVTAWPRENNRRRGFVAESSRSGVLVEIPDEGKVYAELLPGFLPPAVGTVAEIATGGDGRNVIAGG